MELNIDGKPCDLGSERIAVPGYAAAALADVEAAREGRSLTLTIPATMRNDALAGFARDPHTAERFNATLHTAELTAEGSVMLSGKTFVARPSAPSLRSSSVGKLSVPI